jgi:hypothetical protein
LGRGRAGYRSGHAGCRDSVVLRRTDPVNIQRLR